MHKAHDVARIIMHKCKVPAAVRPCGERYETLGEIAQLGIARSDDVDVSAMREVYMYCTVCMEEGL